MSRSSHTRHYASINIHYSRGLHDNREFCDISLLCGRRPRTKDGDQIVRELESVHASRFRGQAFFVDDNFIGNKKNLKEEITPAIAGWMRDRKEPFSFNSQAEIKRASHQDLLEMMVGSGFNIVSSASRPRTSGGWWAAGPLTRLLRRRRGLLSPAGSLY